MRKLIGARIPSTFQSKSSVGVNTHDSRLRKFLGEILCILVAVFLIKTCIAGTYTIPTGSMEHTLLVGDYLLVNQFIYGIKTPPNIPLTDIQLPMVTLFPAMRKPQRGNIVVFNFPGERDERQPDEVKYLIKRCVGTPGDIIEVRDKILYVNGEKFPSYPGMQFIHPTAIPADEALSGMFPHGMRWNPDNYGPLRVPKKGDTLALNANNFSQWSVFIEREGHAAAMKEKTAYVDGKPVTSYTVGRNYYFMMGDNRDNSEDSRFWGFVPEDNIVGQPIAIYFSWDPDIPVTSPLEKIASIRFGRIGKLPE